VKDALGVTCGISKKPAGVANLLLRTQLATAACRSAGKRSACISAQSIGEKPGTPAHDGVPSNIRRRGDGSRAETIEAGVKFTDGFVKFLGIRDGQETLRGTLHFADRNGIIRDHRRPRGR